LLCVKYLGEEVKVTSATAEVPSDIGAVNERWLTDVLRADATKPDPLTVNEVRAEQIAIDTGFSSRLYRIHLTGDGVPASLIVKLPAESEARGAMEMMGGYVKEIDFYRRVAGRAPMGTPRCYAARMALDTSDFVLVLEDLRDWENADHLAGLTLDRARMAIAALAGLHAWSEDSANAAAVECFGSLSTDMTRDVLPSVFEAGWQVYLEKSGASVSPAVANFAARFAERAPVALAALTERNTLVHGDIRADNMFFSDDRLKIVDFQLTARAAGATDIAYLISQGLPTAIRSGRDRELLVEYLDHLGADYPLDEAWRHYRFAVGYLMVLPVIILVTWDNLPERSQKLCLTLVDRAVATFDEIDVAEVF
jgi:aminoglycoside phosphotransferase (APT) family kinase protein